MITPIHKTFFTQLAAIIKLSSSLAYGNIDAGNEILPYVMATQKIRQASTPTTRKKT